MGSLHRAQEIDDPNLQDLGVSRICLQEPGHPGCDQASQDRRPARGVQSARHNFSVPRAGDCARAGAPDTHVHAHSAGACWRRDTPGGCAGDVQQQQQQGPHPHCSAFRDPCLRPCHRCAASSITQQQLPPAQRSHAHCSLRRPRPDQAQGAPAPGLDQAGSEPGLRQGAHDGALSRAVSRTLAALHSSALHACIEHARHCARLLVGQHGTGACGGEVHV